MQNNWNKQLKTFPRGVGLDFLICLSRCNNTDYNTQQKKKGNRKLWFKGADLQEFICEEASKSRQALLVMTLPTVMMIHPKKKKMMVSWLIFNKLLKDYCLSNIGLNLYAVLSAHPALLYSSLPLKYSEK